MTVYVDNMEASYGRMKMCHMWADTREELFAMASKIGVQIKWFQRPNGDCEIGMDASWEHFDIAMSKRKLAVQAGAVETSMYVMALHANHQNWIKAINRGQFEKAMRCAQSMGNAATCIVRRMHDGI